MEGLDCLDPCMSNEHEHKHEHEHEHEQYIEHEHEQGRLREGTDLGAGGLCG